MTEAVLGLLLMLVVTLLLPIIMPPLGVVGRCMDRLLGRANSK